MDLKHKHWALIIVAGLVAIFLVLIIWFVLGTHTATAPTQEATTTTPTATVVPTKLHITEHAKYYDVDLTCPSATPFANTNATADTAAIASMKQFNVQAAAQFKQDGDFANLTPEDIKMMGLDQNKEALTSDYKVYTTSNTISYVFQVFEDTHGAHPNTYYKTFTFNTQTGGVLSLGDIFSSGNYLTLLSNRTRADLPNIIKNETGGDDYTDPDFINPGTEPTTDNFSAFYLEGPNLVILFAPYQVGPYALGTVLDPIPRSQIGDSLKTEYR